MWSVLGSIHACDLLPVNYCVTYTMYCTEGPFTLRMCVCVCVCVRIKLQHCVYDIEHIQWRIQDFPEEGAPTPQLPRGVRQHKILPNFPKNCMKLKEFGP